jgi:hypothetical protein
MGGLSFYNFYAQDADTGFPIHNNMEIRSGYKTTPLD